MCNDFNGAASEMSNRKSKELRGANKSNQGCVHKHTYNFDSPSPTPGEASGVERHKVVMELKCVCACGGRGG